MYFSKKTFSTFNLRILNYFCLLFIIRIFGATESGPFFQSSTDWNFILETSVLRNTDHTVSDYCLYRGREWKIDLPYAMNGMDKSFYWFESFLVPGTCFNSYRSCFLHKIWVISIYQHLEWLFRVKNTYHELSFMRIVL